MSRPRIGLACPIPGERAALLEWLSSAGFDPVPMIDLDSVGRGLEKNGFEALIVDLELVLHAEAAMRLRSLGVNRPLLIVGDDDRAAQAEASRRKATFLARPVHRDLALLAVSLALAEGRPARRSQRRQVARIPASVDGVASRILDVSYHGVRLEVPEKHRTQLPPVFNVRVPMYGLSVVAQRVWVSAALTAWSDQRPGSETSTPAISTHARAESPQSVWCGARLQTGQGNAARAWQGFVDNAPTSSSFEVLKGAI